MSRLYMTGYKSYELGIFEAKSIKLMYLKKYLRYQLIQWIENGIEWFVTGGQNGIELWCAEQIILLKKEYPNIKLAVMPPFNNQETRYNEFDQILYSKVTALADYYQPLYKGEYEHPRQFIFRDQFMLSHTDSCLLIYDEESEGSPKYFYNKVKEHQEKTDYQLQQITFYDISDYIQNLIEEEQFLQ